MLASCYLDVNIYRQEGDEKKITCDLFNAVSVHVKQHAAIDDATPQLKQAVERESRDVRLAPPLSTVFHVFLKLEPPARRRRTRRQGPRM